MPSIIQQERGESRAGLFRIVIRELGRRKIQIPVRLVWRNVVAKHLLQSPVHPFRLPVCLGVKPRAHAL